MLTIKKIIAISCFATVMSVNAQNYKLSTKIVNTYGESLKDAVGLVSGCTSVNVNENGVLNLEVKSDKTILTVSCPGYYSVQVPIGKGKITDKITLVQEGWTKYRNVSSVLEKQDMQNALDIDHAIQGQFAGLNVIQKSGMPGEGSSMNIRGLHSLVAENSPLILINGAPYLGDLNMSNVIKGYSRGLFTALNINDIKSISVLSGPETSVYGSLGTNGVISIETEQAKSDILETRISFSGQYGTNFGTKKLPILNASQYKNYLRDVASTLYDQTGSLYADYPFLQNTTDYTGSYVFNNNTDWQNEIYNKGFTTNNTFRVEGGDEIAKYNLSVGYSSNAGTLGKTRNDRYNTLLNSNIMVTRDLDIFTTLGLSYISSDLQEQGMYYETNPVLAACFDNPLLSPYKPDKDGNLTDNYATYDISDYNANPTYPYENVSNPLAIVKTVEMSDKMYDVNLQFGLKYRFNPYWSATGLYNLFYRYMEENTFIPGVTSRAILPQYYGIGKNTVRRGTNEYKTHYVDLSCAYNRAFNTIHEISASFGTRFLTNSQEADMASGYNTANDYYKTLGYTTDEGYIDGYNNEWIWNNIYGHADYTYDRLLRTTFNVSADASSVSGENAPRYYVYPSGKFTFMSTGLGMLPDWVNKLDVSAGYGLTGNSRFSSNYCKNYYTSTNYFMMSSIIRSNVPNTELEPEKCRQMDLNLDLSLFGNRAMLSARYYRAYAYDLLIAENISAVYASDSYYNNSAEISSHGLELVSRFAPVETRNFSWTLGGTISFDKSIVESLGPEQNEMTISYAGYNNDDAKVKLVVGEAPYQFYGYKTKGVYSTDEEVNEAGLTNVYGNYYQAGDVLFVSTDGNKIINEADKSLLGTAAPKYFGKLFTSFRYRNVTLTADFNYSVGNKAYNAVRRSLESMQTLYNQSTAVLNRWQMQGQKTNMPRATYGDPSGNNLFSDRWIEDASFLRMSDLTLCYDLNHPLFGIFRSGSVWLTGENLFMITDYLGIDPEFAYSYDPAISGFDYGKTGQYRTVKLGFTMNF